MSFAALVLRLIDGADGFQILAYRSAAQFVLIAIATVYLGKDTLAQIVRSIDKTDLFIGMLMAAAFTTYVLSLLNTSVASTLFILSIA